MSALVLSPCPRKLELKGTQAVLTSMIQICCYGPSSSLWALAQQLQGDLRSLVHCDAEIRFVSKPEVPQKLGNSSSASYPIVIELQATVSTRSCLITQGYHLSITEREIHLVAEATVGIFYGLMTLRQLLRQCSCHLPCLEIEDYPDFPTRGVMLDISRDKVPKLQTLFALLDLFAEWKINHLQLYIEHTFAYRQHRDVWAQASPYTSEDILTIDHYCQQRFIDLVPNQNSFGHLHRWLTLPQYRHLAECPEGFRWPWGEWNAFPFSLCPTLPESLDLLEEWYSELLPNFQSPYFNVGCDETFDLGQGRSKDACDAYGKGKVYLDFLLKIHKRVDSHHRQMMFWGDIILEHPEYVSELPKEVIALAWGYEANHPFDEQGAKFADAGIPFYVCPGTSSWNSIAGRTANCIENLRQAAANGLKHGASGYLITDWGDRGHWQPLPVSYPGFLAGASFSWCLESNQHLALSQALDQHVFWDQAKKMGTFCLDLGNVYQIPNALMANNSILFQLLFREASHKVFEKVTVAHLHETENKLHNLLVELSQTQLQCYNPRWVHQEFENVIQMLIHSCHRGIAVLQSQLEDRSTQDKLAQEMRLILGLFQQVWLFRNREGGLQDSLKVLQQRLSEYGLKGNESKRVF
ncbi:family 20 glycosylhydrolase [Deltaproteobacteria bacterium TL4]